MLAVRTWNNGPPTKAYLSSGNGNAVHLVRAKVVHLRHVLELDLRALNRAAYMTGGSVQSGRNSSSSRRLSLPVSLENRAAECDREEPEDVLLNRRRSSDDQADSTTHNGLELVEYEPVVEAVCYSSALLIVS